MSYTFYTNMQKRGDGKVYADLHKTDGRIYYAEEDALRAIVLDPQIAETRHVVEMVAMTAEEHDRRVDIENKLIAALKGAIKEVEGFERRTGVPQFLSWVTVAKEALKEAGL